MDHQNPVSDNHMNSTPLAVISFITGVFAAIVNNIEIYTRIGAAAVAIASGAMAIRYYYYATKEKKESLKNSKSDIK